MAFGNLGGAGSDGISFNGIGNLGNHSNLGGLGNTVNMDNIMSNNGNNMGNNMGNSTGNIVNMNMQAMSGGLAGNQMKSNQLMNMGGNTIGGAGNNNSVQPMQTGTNFNLQLNDLHKRVQNMLPSSNNLGTPMMMEGNTGNPGAAASSSSPYNVNSSGSGETVSASMMNTAVCVFRIMQVFQQQRKRGDNRIEFWRLFVKEFYAPGATVKHCMSHYVNDNDCRPMCDHFPYSRQNCALCSSNPGHGFEYSGDALARLYKLNYENGLEEELLFITSHSQSLPLPGGLASILCKIQTVSVYNNVRLRREGNLRVIFDAQAKITSWEFCAHNHEHMHPTHHLKDNLAQICKLSKEVQLASQNGTLSMDQLQNTVAGMQRMVQGLMQQLEAVEVSEYGLEEHVMRGMQVADGWESLEELMDLCVSSQCSPLEGLKACEASPILLQQAKQRAQLYKQQQQQQQQQQPNTNMQANVSQMLNMQQNSMKSQIQMRMNQQMQQQGQQGQASSSGNLSGLMDSLRAGQHSAGEHSSNITQRTSQQQGSPMPWAGQQLGSQLLQQLQQLQSQQSQNLAQNSQGFAHSAQSVRNTNQNQQQSMLQLQQQLDPKKQVKLGNQVLQTNKDDPSGMDGNNRSNTSVTDKQLAQLNMLKLQLPIGGGMSPQQLLQQLPASRGDDQSGMDGNGNNGSNAGVIDKQLAQLDMLKLQMPMSAGQSLGVSMSQQLLQHTQQQLMGNQSALVGQKQSGNNMSQLC